MNVKLQADNAVGTGLLALSMTALDFGFAMFFMSPYEALHNPQVWLIATLPALALATTTVIGNLLHIRQRI